MYGEGVMGVSREVYMKWALELKRKFFTKRKRNIQDEFFPAPWFTMRYINYLRYRDGCGLKSGDGSTINRRADNVRFIEDERTTSNPITGLKFVGNRSDYAYYCRG